MIITKAVPTEYNEIRHFYHSLIDAIEGAEYHPKWKKDIYPSPNDLHSALSEGTLYIGRCDGRIAGAMVVNQKCHEAYHTVSWPMLLSEDEFMVIHMFGVHSDFTGRGFAKQFVRFALDHAKKSGMKAIRLDVIKGNLPAERLYESFGFGYVETVPMFYENCGRMDFDLYELVITA